MISKIAADVRATFERRGIAAAVDFGRRKRWRRLNQGPVTGGRVLFQPGDESGNLGTLGPAHQPGPRVAVVEGEAGENVTRTSRALRTWEARYTIFVWVPRGEADDEAEDFEAAEALLQETIRAVHERGEWYATGAVDDASDEPSEIRNGIELRVALSTHFAVVDVPTTRVFPSPLVSRGEPPT